MSANGDRPAVARVFPMIRAGHIEDLDAVAPAETRYFHESYDLSGTEVPQHIRQTSLVHLLTEVRRLDSSDVLEVWEPLWLRYLPHWFAVVGSIWLRRLLKRQAPRVVLFAIENNTARASLFDRTRVPELARRAVIHGLRILFNAAVDRVAFGSDGAKAAYQELVTSVPQTRVFLDLPAREHAIVAASGTGAVFVGPLEARKGIPELMTAWESLDSRDGWDVKLTLVGGGELEQEVRLWAERQPTTREAVGFVPHAIAIEYVRDASVVVAPSVRVSGWREQIGRPIREALAYGRTVVTSDETGLAAYLERERHSVVPAADLGPNLAASIEQALGAPLSPELVVAALPAIDGRVAADRWLRRTGTS